MAAMEKKRILIVDDRESFTRVVKAFFERTGRYAVHTEHRGAKGLSAARELHPDLILLDLMMPDMDGGSVASDIRSDDSFKTTPIVFLSAAVTEEEALTLHDSFGGCPLIPKSRRLDQLLKWVDRYLGMPESTESIPED